MTPDDRVDEVIRAFLALPVPARPELELPAGAVPARPSRNHSHRRLWMKLGIGGLAAALALGLGLLAATPQVTLAQAVREVQKHQAVRYKREWVATEKVEQAAKENFKVSVIEDLTKNQHAGVINVTQDGKRQARLEVFSAHTRRWVTVEPAPPEFVEALAAEAAADGTARDATLGGIMKEDLAKFLSQFDGIRDVHRVIIAGTPWVGKGNDGERLSMDLAQNIAEGYLAQTPLLDRMKQLADSKDSVTTRVKLDNRPAIKIVGTEENRLVAPQFRKANPLPTTVWLDPATRLPLRIEQVQFEKLMVQSQFEWDPKLPAGLRAEQLFSTEPPAGYPLTVVVE